MKNFIVIFLLFLYTTLAQNKYETSHKFIWEDSLKSYVNSAYGDNTRVYYRLAQCYCESGFNVLATSDFAGWKKKHVDTLNAIKKNMGAAGLCQFIWKTAILYNATTVDTKQAFAVKYSTDIYNPLWSLKSMCRYMSYIDFYLLNTKNKTARRKLVIDKEFAEEVSCAAYNTGEGRVLDRLNKYSDWLKIKQSILPEPGNYADKINNVAKNMATLKRFKDLK